MVVVGLVSETVPVLSPLSLLPSLEAGQSPVIGLP